MTRFRAECMDWIECKGIPAELLYDGMERDRFVINYSCAFTFRIELTRLHTQENIFRLKGVTTCFIKIRIILYTCMLYTTLY